MDIQPIKDQVQTFRKENKRIFTSSSFQTHSIPLLHILSRIDNSIPIYFLNTGYHFPETLEYKELITKMYDLNVIDLESHVPKHLQVDSGGMLLFTSNPDYCCFLNKVQPMEPVLMSYDVWINGIRAGQNENRKKMKTFEKASHNTLRYHPILQWTNKMIWDYIKTHEIPRHPLEMKGYISIGCEPCTRKFDGSDERMGRWFGMEKTECGLNTDLVQK